MNLINQISKSDFKLEPQTIEEFFFVKSFNLHSHTIRENFSRQYTSSSRFIIPRPGSRSLSTKPQLPKTNVHQLPPGMRCEKRRRRKRNDIKTTISISLTFIRGGLLCVGAHLLTVTRLMVCASRPAEGPHCWCMPLLPATLNAGSLERHNGSFCTRMTCLYTLDVPPGSHNIFIYIYTI